MANPVDCERLHAKQQFYNGLASLDESDDEADLGLQESMNALRRPSKARTSRQVRNTKETEKPGDPNTVRAPRIEHARSLPRSVSDIGPVTAPKSMTRDQTAVANAPENPKDEVFDMERVRHTFAGTVPPTSSMPQATGKRKRDSAVNPMPKDQQIFDGFHFYFFPNNEKHPARFMRLTKAIAFGATWQRDWNSHVTHVVLDKSMDYSMLLRFLKKDSLPAGVIAVNESWPSECIAYRTLLEASRPQFKVLGAPATAQQLPQAQPPASSADSETSLKLKPPGKDVEIRQPETQSQTEQMRRAEIQSDKALTNIAEPAIEPPANAESTDELDAAISQAKDLQMVPLDDEEIGSRPGSSGVVSAHPVLISDDHQQKRTTQNFQDKFQCMQKHTGEVSNTANAATITILQQMADYYGQMGDEWRIRAYRKAIATLRNHPTKVCTKEEALALPSVGDRLATKIEEIAFTNRLRRLDNALAEPQDHILQTFMKVYGAGFVHASHWVRQGFKTLDELLQKADLTENQKIGIDHFEDFQERIPRAEVTRHGEIVRQAMQKLDPAFQITIGGSYRRGAKDSGDIDFIITRPDTGIDHIRAVVVEQLVPTLYSQDFLKASLAATSGDGSKWHGACCLPGHKIWRRIDFLLVPWAEMGAALIYFTGNDIFNRSLRLLASTKGFRLNQRGLYKDVIRGKNRDRVTEGTLVEGRDERRIFEILGVPWRPPEHRIP